MEDVSNNFEAQDSELKRENRMLQMQLDELRLVLLFFKSL